MFGSIFKKKMSIEHYLENVVSAVYKYGLPNALRGICLLYGSDFYERNKGQNDKEFLLKKGWSEEDISYFVKTYLCYYSYLVSNMKVGTGAVNVSKALSKVVDDFDLSGAITTAIHLIESNVKYAKTQSYGAISATTEHVLDETELLYQLPRLIVFQVHTEGE